MSQLQDLSVHLSIDDTMFPPCDDVIRSAVVDFLNHKPEAFSDAVAATGMGRVPGIKAALVSVTAPAPGARGYGVTFAVRYDGARTVDTDLHAAYHVTLAWEIAVMRRDDMESAVVAGWVNADGDRCCRFIRTPQGDDS